jgi:hypothetical protein
MTYTEGAAQGQAQMPSASTRGHLGAAPSQPFDWLAAAYQGAYQLSIASMLQQYADSQQLSAATKLVQKLGQSSQTFSVTIDGVTSDETVSELINQASKYASQSGQQNQGKASAYEAAAGQAQAEQSQDVQIGQQFTSQETNQATSVDTSTTTQTTSEIQSLNSAFGQWASMTGNIGA